MKQSFQVVSKGVPTKDPFLDLDRDKDVFVEDKELQDVITHAASKRESMHSQ